MTEDVRRELQKAILDFHLPRYHELPDMGLYLDQVVRYVNRYTPNPLTPSMVSNYVKQHTIPGPNKKSYGAESIAYLIFISYVKSVASMDDIRLLIDVQQESYTLQRAYDYFCDEFENLLQFVYGMKASPDRVGGDDTNQKDLLRTALMSIAYKEYLDHCLRLVKAAEINKEN